MDVWRSLKMIINEVLLKNSTNEACLPLKRSGLFCFNNTTSTVHGVLHSGIYQLPLRGSQSVDLLKIWDYLVALLELVQPTDPTEQALLDTILLDVINRSILELQ